MGKDENKKMMGLLAILSALVGFDAVAQETPGGGFYMAASVGRPKYEFSNSRGMLIVIGSPFGSGVFTAFPDDIEVSNQNGSWGGTLGYRINRYFAAELGYLDFGEGDVTERYVFEQPPIPFFPTEIGRNYFADVSGPIVSVIGSLPVGSRFELFVRAGVLSADQTVEERFTNGSNAGTFGSEVLVVYERGSGWVGDTLAEQKLDAHGKYMLDLYEKGALKFAGPFLDDSGGAVVLEAADKRPRRRSSQTIRQ